MSANRHVWVALLGVLVAGCSTNTGAGEHPAKTDRSTKNRTDTAQAAHADRTPLSSFRMYLNGFHFQNGDPGTQVEEHHFCSKVNEDITQCLLFDGNGETAHLTGIEYVVSRRMFESFAPEERKLWHSHVYEVKSGQLIAPGLSDTAERELMAQHISTYGKVWHTWHSQHNDQLPTGAPSLWMGFTADGQLKPELLQFRDERMQVSAADKRKERESIPDPGIEDDADSWQKGTVMQLQLSPVKSPRKEPGANAVKGKAAAPKTR